MKWRWYYVFPLVALVVTVLGATVSVTLQSPAPAPSHAGIGENLRLVTISSWKTYSISKTLYIPFDVLCGTAYLFFALSEQGPGAKPK